MLLPKIVLLEEDDRDQEDERTIFMLCGACQLAWMAPMKIPLRKGEKKPKASGGLSREPARPNTNKTTPKAA